MRIMLPAFAAVLVATLAIASQPDATSLVEVDAIMPPLATDAEDEYLCTSVELPDRPMKLVSVESLSQQDTVHHMLLFGCKSPAKHKPVWRCRMAPACGPGGEHVLYGWGKNAPPVHLPAGAGFSVGPGSGTRSVVLQVHYLNLRPENDSSGVRLRLTPNPVPYSAGLVAFAATFSVPPRKESTLVPNECCYSGFEPLHGFASRVHTHALGRSVFLEQTAAVLGSGEQHTRQVFQQDPQLPQGFYPAEPPISIHPGDKLRATCDFNSSHMDKAVNAGHTSSDEMCNLYLMLYSELPFFMWCVDGGEWVEGEGAGGMPADGTLLPEEQEWVPPARLRAAPVQPAAAAAAEEPASVNDSAPFGQVTGLFGADDGTVWAFSRATRTWTGRSFDPDTKKFTKAAPINWPVVTQISRDNGTVLRSWGSGQFWMPHMITLDPQGNVWVVDTGAHQALKFSPQGEKLLTLGQPLQPGSNDTSFCMPTHVVVTRNGTIFVGDGYCNSRIVQFSPSGDFQREIKLPVEHNAPAPLPHSMALDECKGRLYVTDREVGRVYALSLESGESLGHWDLAEDHGLPYAIRIGPYGTPLVLVWDRDRSGDSFLVALSQDFGQVITAWPLEGAQAPHDLALVPAPLAVSGPGERLLAVVVAECGDEHSSRLRKYFLRGPHHHAVEHAPAEALQQGDEQLPAGLGAAHAGHGGAWRHAGGAGRAISKGEADEAADSGEGGADSVRKEGAAAEHPGVEPAGEAPQAKEPPAGQQKQHGGDGEHAGQHAQQQEEEEEVQKEGEQQPQLEQPASQVDGPAAEEEQEVKEEEEEEEQMEAEQEEEEEEEEPSSGYTWSTRQERGSAAEESQPGSWFGLPFAAVIVGLVALASAAVIISRVRAARHPPTRGYRHPEDRRAVY